MVVVFGGLAASTSNPSRQLQLCKLLVAGQHRTHQGFDWYLGAILALFQDSLLAICQGSPFIGNGF